MMPILCHILIGCPSSGKSTLAAEIVKSDNNYRIVSTDTIRKQLFGDETIQGNWQQVETEVLRQIQQHLEAGHPIIYDATNAQRPWRIALLQNLQQYSDIQWIGWYLETPLATCQTWNQQRQRQVPENIIIQMHQSLTKLPPIAAEGFTAVYSIDPSKGKPAIQQLQNKITKLPRTPINRHNRTHNKNLTFHSYSQLLDFDRLMHLISLLLHYPGIGNLQTTDPEGLKELLGEDHAFDTSLEEICAALAKHANPIYADAEAITQDLQWLETNGIIGQWEINAEIHLSTIDNPHLVTHPYSDIEPFQRLIQTIRFILHHPLTWYQDQGTLDSLVSEMRQQELIHSDCGDSIRKDIEKVLKPFKILPEISMRRGYFAGTAILSPPDLIKVYQLLEAQAQSLEDPLALQVYETFQERMEQSKIASPQEYPVRAIYNSTIVDIETVSATSLVQKIDQVEKAIKEGRLLELNRIKGGGRFSDEPDQFFLAFPLQIVFHNIGWYLGFECEGGNTPGLLRFERLDRLFLGRPQYKTRQRNDQEKSLNKLKTLYDSSGGIFLGNDPQTQSSYLSRNASKRKQAEVTIELWFSDRIFRFISEGTKRFPLKQMKMSHPRKVKVSKTKKQPFTLEPTGDPDFPNCFQVTLPKWSLEDVDLLRWILGFGGEVKVVEPPELVEVIRDKGEAISKVYQSIV